MAYSDFTTLSKVRTAFDLTLNETTHLFTNIAPIEPSDYLKITLNEFVPLANAINTEKARSELIIAPVLLEVRRHFNFQVGFFSGTDFNVDPTVGLSGYCDYILTASQEMYEIYAPVVTLVEAKNENIKSGLGQSSPLAYSYHSHQLPAPHPYSDHCRLSQWTRLWLAGTENL